MLADDELDFDDDFGDLGELETGGLTTEELEKELGLDLELDLEPISEESLDKSKKDTSEKVTKDNNKKQDEKPKQEEEKKVTSKTEENNSTTSKQVEPPKKPEVQSKQEEKKPNQQTPAKKYDSTKKPIPTSLDNQYNNNNNFNNGNRNFNQMGYYPMQQQPMFYPQMQANFMAMNGMFPYQQQQQQQPFTNRNRIYVNPNFKGGNAQVMGQRPPMAVQKTTGEEQKNLLEQKAREELLNKQRMEAAESLRKKLASKKAEGGIKRKLPDAPTSPSKRPTTESIQTKPSNGGFSILGAAKARATGPVTQQQQQPQTRVRSAVENNIRKLSTPATSRINRREEVSPMTRPPPVQRPSPVARPSPVGPSVSIPKVPIVTNGKSNVVLITNLKPDITFNQIKSIADSESGTNNISYNKEEGSATVTFPMVENAVTFRRKYNRTQMGESHINIAFKK